MINLKIRIKENRMRYRIDDAIVDIQKRRVQIGRNKSQLSDLSLQCLLIFIEQPNQLVLKETLLQRCWQSMVVSDEVLKQRIYLINQCFLPLRYRVIKNIRGKGYILSGRVRKSYGIELLWKYFR